MATNDSEYLEQLTWLRGIAALLVVLSHSVRAASPDYLSTTATESPLLLSMAGLGTFGVGLFFVLSGTTLLISARQRPTTLWRFYVKRVLRIWPAFIVSLAAYVVFGFLFATLYGEPRGAWIESQFLSPYQLTDLLSHALLIFNITGGVDLFNNAYWSLPVEFQYYILFPLALLSLRLFSYAGPIVVGGALYGAYRLNLSGFADDLVFMIGYSFFFGMVLGEMRLRAKPVINPKIGVMVLISCLLIAWQVDLVSDAMGNFPFLSNVWHLNIMAALISVAVALNCDFSVPHFARKQLNHYGTISYSTYLYHNLVIGGMLLLLLHLGIHAIWLKFGLIFAGAIVLTYFLASVSYLYIEKPFMQLMSKDRQG